LGWCAAPMGARAGTVYGVRCEKANRESLGRAQVRVTYIVDIYPMTAQTRRMKKTMMYLPEEMHDFLSEEAGRRGVSMAEVAREAIAEYRARSETPPKHNYTAIVGIIDDDDGPTDISERVDEYMAEYYKVGGTWDQEHGLADPD